MSERASFPARCVRIVSWNLQGNHGVDAAAVAAVLGELDADVVALQEVQRRQAAEVAAAAGYGQHTWAFKHWPVKYAAEGHAVLTHGTLRRRRVTTISRREPPWSWRRRVALSVEVALDDTAVANTAVANSAIADGAALRLVDTHLGAGVGDDERVRQARRILAVAAPEAVIVGDLNTHPGSPVLAEFARAGRVDAWGRLGGASAPATNWSGPRDRPPAQRIDFVLVPDGLRVVAATVPADWARLAPLSDHLPVVVDLEPVS